MRFASAVSPLVVVVLLLMSYAARAQDKPGAPAKTLTYGGRVVAADGKPVANADVFLAAMTGRDDREEVLVSRSGADGAFAFKGVKAVPDAGRHLFARAEGFGVGQVYASAGGENDIALPPATSVRVTFLDPAGNPVPSLRVRPTMAMPRQPGFAGSGLFPRQLSDALARVTGADGACTFADLPQSASIRLEVSDPRFAYLSYRDNVETRGAADSPPATVRLRAGGTIAGVVTYGPSGKPAAGVEVTAQHVSTPDADGWGRAVTNDRGEYRMEQVAAGDYNVMLGRNEEPFGGEWTAAARERVRLGAGQHLGGQNLTLIKGVLVTGRVVRSDSGKGAPDVSVGVHGPDHPRSSAMIGGATTGADGSYTVRVVPGENYLYVASMPPDGYKRPEARTVTVADGRPITVDFPLPRKPGRPVAGRVLGPDDKPVAGAFVTAEGKDGDMHGTVHQTADAEGNFYFEAITRGTILRAGGKDLETPEITIVDGGEPEVVLRLAPRVRITLAGDVTDPDGKPIAGARVQVITHEGQYGTGMGKPELTDAKGRYRIPGLIPSGRYSVEAAADGFGRGVAKVILQAGEPVAEAPPLRLEPATAAIGGVVVDDQDRPVAGVKVELNGSSTGHQIATTDAQGRFSFKVVNGARALVYVRSADGKILPSVDVRSGQTTVRLTAAAAR